MPTCYQTGAEMARMCGGTIVSSEKITGTDQYTGDLIVMLFKTGLQNYCWGQRFSAKFVFYFEPSDYDDIAQIVNDDDCIAFHFHQTAPFDLDDCHWY